VSFCQDCNYWCFEQNPALRNDEELEGFGLCELFDQMSSNRQRAIVRTDDEYARIQTRAEFGCNLFEKK